jgi:hypothetical protein
MPGPAPGPLPFPTEEPGDLDPGWDREAVEAALADADAGRVIAFNSTEAFTRHLADLDRHPYAS